MKKIYYVLMMLAAMCFYGCKENADIDHPIAGHKYCNYMNTDYGYSISYAEFHSAGNFTMIYVTHTLLSH